MPAAALVLVMTLAPADASAPPPDAAVSDAGELQGEWEVVSALSGKGDETRLYQGDRWAFSGARGRGPLSGKAAAPLSLWCSPPRADLVCGGRTVRRGIYRRAGDGWVWGDPDGPEPSSFEPAPGHLVLTLRRVKK
jgi:hypothetical protein